MKFRYAIFDLDMTLIDSIKPLMVSANLVAKEFGLSKVTYEDVYQAEVSVPNCTFELLWKNLWGHYDPCWYQAYVHHMTEVEYAAMELYPTCLETLEALKKIGVPIGMASNRDFPRKILRTLGVEHFFSAVVGEHDVEKPKPAPDMIIKTVELLNAPRHEVLYIGDSKGDLKAAAAAGVKVFSMTTGGHSADEMLSLGAIKTGTLLIEVVDLFRH